MDEARQAIRDFLLRIMAANAGLRGVVILAYDREDNLSIEAKTENVGMTRWMLDQAAGCAKTDPQTDTPSSRTPS